MAAFMTTLGGRGKSLCRSGLSNYHISTIKVSTCPVPFQRLQNATSALPTFPTSVSTTALSSPQSRPHCSHWFTRVAPLMLERANVTNSQAYLSGVYIHVLQWKNLHTAFKLTKAILLLYNTHTDSRS